MSKKNHEQGNSSHGGGRDGFAAIAYFVFVVIAIIYLVQAILGVTNLQTNAKVLSIIGNIQYVVTILLFLLVAMLAWQCARRMSRVWKILYWFALLFLIAAYVLPFIF